MKKKYLIAITIAGLAMSANAQKLLSPKIDKIRGDTVWSTSDERIFTRIGFGSSDILYSYTQKIGKDYVLVFRIDNNNGATSLTVTDANITNLKFTDNTVMNLKPSTSGQADTRFTEHGTRNIALFYYTLNPDNIKALEQKNISYIRVSTLGGNLDYEIKPKNSELIKKEIELITAK